MDVGVISVRYARALLKSAAAQKCEEQVYKDMLQLSDSFIKVPQLRQAIDNPMLDDQSKTKLIVTALGAEHAPLSEEFAKLVVREDREDIMQLMAASFVTLYRKEKNIIRGRLITAVPVVDDTKAKMQRMVESKTKGTVEFESEVNPDIIGGFILEYDTYRLDCSVKSKLNTILNKLS